MAQFTKTHGDYKPVVVVDDGVTSSSSGAGWSSGLNAVVDGATVQPQGPKLDYFTVTGSGALTTAQVNTLVQTIQQLATVYIYQYNANGSSADSLGFAAYPTQAWTTTTLDAAFTAAGVTGTTSSTGATFAGIGEA